jgi:hypothetical protein
MAMKKREGVEIYLHYLLISALDGGKKAASRPARFTLRKEPWYTLDRRLGRPQSRSGQRQLLEESFAVAGNQIAVIQPAA